MLDRYPEQSAARRGYALVGVLFALFALAMAWFESTIGAAVGLAGAALLIGPALCCGRVAFARYEKWLSRIAPFGNL
ncbi:hypothetical protein SAMN05216221_1518 [Pseudomonas oryzae]|uniref:Uncharacterized protein n=2 Tax=Pseudomonas oryzae TaxID=1392877 RepID=A0A1H1R417_9PSED|nr:hypothetical protein SAMN05216221_1518 [Pseudomonas oryzae]